MFGCVLKQLDDQVQIEAAVKARAINPVNSVSRRLGNTLGIHPGHIALLVNKYWGAKGVNLGVTFLDTQDSSLKNKILTYANKWGQYGNVKFRESSNGEIRLARAAGQGYYSYLGTDILSVPKNQQTMNLEAFTLGTPDSEYDRVVCHEFGHTLGFPHEHERREVLDRLDVEKTVAWFSSHYGWDRNTTMQQVFDPLDPASIRATQADDRSIMCYQFAGECTKTGQPIPGGDKIDSIDAGFVPTVYPPVTPPPPPPPPPGGGGTAGLGTFGLSLNPSAFTNGLNVGSVAQLVGTMKVTGLPSGAAPDKPEMLPPVITALLAKYGWQVLAIVVRGIVAHKTWKEIEEDVLLAIAGSVLS